jgi:hypothetical protein
LLLWWLPSLSDVNLAWEVERPGTDVCVIVGVGSGESVPDTPAGTSVPSVIVR